LVVHHLFVDFKKAHNSVRRGVLYNILTWFGIPMKLLKKVKQSQYRPGQSQRVLRKLRFPDFVTTAQDGGRLSASCTSHLYSQEILLVLISVTCVIN